MMWGCEEQILDLKMLLRKAERIVWVSEVVAITVGVIHS
jgi:hypothetical protein